MRKIFLLSILLLSLLSVTNHTLAQEVASIGQLKEQIQKLEAVAHTENLPAEVREVNDKFLAERRNRLHYLLGRRIAALEEYLLTTGALLSKDEIQLVEKNIKNLRAELQGLDAVESSRVSDTTERGTPQLTGSLLAVQPASGVNEAVPAPSLPQSQDKPIQSDPMTLSPGAAAYIRQPTAEIVNGDYARGLIEAAFNAGAFRDPLSGAVLAMPDLDSPDFHCVIHVLRWSDPSGTRAAAGGGDQTVSAQNWYVYNNGKAKGLRSDRIWSKDDFATANRIYGVKKIWLLYVHLNKWNSVTYTAYYDFNFVKRTATNVGNLIALAQIFASFTKAAAAGGAPVLAQRENVWGGSFAETNYVPSDVTVTANITKDPVNGPFVALDKPKKYDNDGLYWWDVSVGVPIRRIKELQFDTTNNTVTSKEVDKQNAFALLDLYFPPKDLKGTSFSWIPHFVGGVAIAKQPLKKFMFGAGFGPNFANFYVGALFTEHKDPATLKEGSTATPAQLNADIRKHFKPQLTFGINVPVRAVLETLNKEKK
jgi:hypothetical protein